jgi:hypothetical protein
MTVRPPQSVLLEVPNTFEPLVPSDPIVAFFRHNWREPTTVSTSWLTSINFDTYTESEQRTALMTRPRREVTSLHTALSDRQIYHLRQFLDTASPTHTAPAGGDPLQGLNQSWASGLYCDEAEITGVGSASGTNYQLEFDLRPGYRFYVGGRVFCFNAEEQTVATNVELMAGVGILTAVGVATVQATFTSPFVPQGGMRLIPALDVQPLLEFEVSGVGSGGAEASLTTVEINGSNALPPFPSNVGLLFPKYDDITIFEPNHNWTEPQVWGKVRQGGAVTSGKGNVSYLDGERPRHRTNFSLTETREGFFPVLRLFDSLRGRLLPMWVVTDNPLSEGRDPIVHPGGTVLTFPRRHIRMPFRAIAARTVQCDPSEVRRVVSSTLSTITLDTALPAGTYHINGAYLGRFESDTLTEQWYTSMVVECDFSTVEILNEQDVTI